MFVVVKNVNLLLLRFSVVHPRKRNIAMDSNTKSKSMFVWDIERRVSATLKLSTLFLKEKLIFQIYFLHISCHQ